MTKLYEFAEQYKFFIEYSNDVLETEDGNDEDMLEMLINTLESIEDGMESKVENIAKYIKSLESDRAAYKAEKDRLAKLQRSTENKIERLKQYTQDMLMLAGKDNIKAGVFNVRLQKNPPSVFIADPNKIPEQYRVKQEDKILTKEILSDLKKGAIVEGAEIAPETKHIRFT
jgi:Siphovirus Gp157.